MMSIKLVEDILLNDSLLTRDDLGFILTVLRDNSSDDVSNLLDIFLKNLDTKLIF